MTEFNCKPQILRKFTIHGKEHIKLQTHVKFYKAVHSLKLLISHANYFIHSMTLKWKHSSRQCKQDYKANDTSKQAVHQNTLSIIITRGTCITRKLYMILTMVYHSLFGLQPLSHFHPHPPKKCSWTATIPIL